MKQGPLLRGVRIDPTRCSEQSGERAERLPLLSPGPVEILLRRLLD